MPLLVRHMVIWCVGHISWMPISYRTMDEFLGHEFHSQKRSFPIYARTLCKRMQSSSIIASHEQLRSAINWLNSTNLPLPKPRSLFTVHTKCTKWSRSVDLSTIYQKFGSLPKIWRMGMLNAHVHRSICQLIDLTIFFVLSCEWIV